MPRRENVHENEHCRAGVSKTKSKIRTSAEANEGLQLKSDFVIPKGMTVFFGGGCHPEREAGKQRLPPRGSPRSLFRKGGRTPLLIRCAAGRSLGAHSCGRPPRAETSARAGQAPQRFPERRRFSTRSGCAEEKRIDSRTSPHPALDGSAHPPLRRTGSCGGGDVPVLVCYGSREPYGKSSGIAEPKTFT